MSPPIIVILVLDAIAIWLGLANLGDRPRMRWATHPLFIMIWVPTAMVIVAFCARVWVGGTGGTADNLITLFASIIFILPQAFLVLAFGVKHILHVFNPNPAKGIIIDKTCDSAQAAEMRDEFPEAERLYRKALAQETPQNAGLYGRVHLKFANFLQKRERFNEALEHWQQALKGDLPADQTAVTAMRAAETATEQLGDIATAVDILRGTVQQLADEPEAAALRTRLQALQAPNTNGKGRET